jgi:hypothetical protein
VDFIDMLRIVARRWVVVVPVLLIGALAAAAVASTVPAEYTATGSMLVIEEDQQTGSLSTPVFAEAMQDTQARAAVTALGGAGRYRVEAGGEDILRVSSEASSSEEATETVNLVLDQLSPTLDQRKAEIESNAALGIEILNRPSTALQVSADPPTFQAVGSARVVGNSEPAFSAAASARLLDRVLEDTSVAASILAGTQDTTYSVATSRDLPTVTVTATGTDEAAVLQTVERTIASAEGRLSDLFELVGKDASGIAVRTLVPPEQATVDTRGIFRSVIALLAVTAGVAVTAAYAWEGIVDHRGRRRPPRPTAGPSTVGAPIKDDRSPQRGSSSLLGAERQRDADADSDGQPGVRADAAAGRR